MNSLKFSACLVSSPDIRSPLAPSAPEIETQPKLWDDRLRREGDVAGLVEHAAGRNKRGLGGICAIVSGARRSGGWSNLDFETDLDNLRCRYAEISGRQIGVEMHRRKDPLTPNRHPGDDTTGHNHDPARVKGDSIGVDAAQSRVAAGEFEVHP